MPEGVDVGVNQAGDEGFAAKVFVLGVASGKGAHFGVGANGEDAGAFDGDGLGDGELVVDGDDFAVVENEVGCDFVG